MRKVDKNDPNQALNRIATGSTDLYREISTDDKKFYTNKTRKWIGSSNNTNHDNSLRVTRATWIALQPKYNWKLHKRILSSPDGFIRELFQISEELATILHHLLLKNQRGVNPS